ncbi:MAG TPA: TonB-dependent receptor, partial [Vicinamibacterales bacterium]|nr:TonB-dependent receptor [Vicinamibacterales bacterium]
MKKFAWIVATFGALAIFGSPAVAQDYRARVQGSVLDESKGVLPGVSVTLRNDATGVAVTRITDAEGHYIFDFVDPGSYSITAELQGFRTVEQRNVSVQQRGDVTVHLTLGIGGLEERVIVEAAPVTVQFNSSSAELTLERQLIDQVPIGGRNPYNIAALDPTVFVSPATSENRPYHHAYANDYDAGGGTRRANDVLLDGVPLGASFKTSYTPAVDAVEEITISKNSVDAENGNSLGGIISLNMKSGTNAFKGSGYGYFRDPSLNSRADPTLRVSPGIEPLRGSELRMVGGTLGGPIKRNRIFSFTSFEQWNDNRPLSVVRTVPTELERRGDFSQSRLSNGTLRTIYNPFSSTLDASGRVVRQPFAGNVIPSSMFDPVAMQLLANIPLPNLPGNVDNLQYSVSEKVEYWNFSQRFDVNFSDAFKVFARAGVFKADLYQDNPIGGGAGFFPLSGSNRDGMSVAGDAVWVMSNRTTLNVRGSFYNMVDEFYNPSLLLGGDGLASVWPSRWYSSLYNSGYVYYPALDVTAGTGTNTSNRLGRQGREWYQHPDAWNVSARMNRYQGDHNMKWGGEVRAYYGEAARFEPINLVFNSALTANSSDSPQVASTGNQWATFLLGALDNQTSARLVPLQTPNLRGYSAYFQDDWKLSDRVTLNLGLRWEYEPGATDPDNRLSQGLDLTQPIPEMQATPPNMPAQAAQLMSSRGYSWSYNGAWQFTTEESPRVWETSWTNFMPRFGLNYRLMDDAVVRFAYARFLMPITNVRDTLGDFVNQYAGFAQTTTTLGLANGRPQQQLADPFPTNNPVQQPTGQTLGRYTGLGGAVSFDQYELRPQINDRVSVSYQKELWGNIILDAAYFFNWGSRVPYTLNLNMRDPAFTYEYGALLNTQVANPFRNYLTREVFPGSLRNNATVALGSLLVPYPQYGAINQTNTSGGRNLKTHSIDLRVQRPFKSGISFLAAYAFQRDHIENWLGDIEQYQVLQTGGKDGWHWQPPNPSLPEHRLTGALTWQVPVGRDRAFLSDMPSALDYVLGGWQYTTAVRIYSGRPVLFTDANAVSGDPKLDSPTRDRWFDTSVFAAQPAFTPRTNPVYFDGLTGPGAWFMDMTLTKSFPIRNSYRIEARLEAYNALNHIVWDQPDTTFGSSNFGSVTRKRVDSYGREIQVGLR